MKQTYCLTSNTLHFKTFNCNVLNTDNVSQVEGKITVSIQDCYTVDCRTWE